MGDGLLVKPTGLDGVRLLTVPFSHEDARGENVETYNQRLLRRSADDILFVQDSFSRSTRGVLRGIHGDAESWKLLSCPFGRVYVVVVNNIRGHAQHRKWEGFVLSDRNRLQLLVPPMFGNGHLVLSEEALFAYKISSYTDTARQFSIAWNDPELAIDWPLPVGVAPLLSRRDRGLS